MIDDNYIQGSFDDIDSELFSSVSSNKIQYDDKTVGFRAQIAMQIAQISYRQLDYWARTDLVVPTIKVGNGSGSHRLYSFKDILILKVVKRLLDTGISLQNIRLTVGILEKRGVSSLSEITLISDGSKVYECTSKDEIYDLLSNGQGVFGITVGTSISELSGDIKNFPFEEIGNEKYELDELSKRRQNNIKKAL